MYEDRGAAITVGGQQYTLMLTTRATKEIGKRYGGLDNLGSLLMGGQDFSMALDEILWLVALLANQSVLIHNMQNKDAPRELLTAEELELLTTPAELAGYRSAITEALLKGTKRYVESEGPEKKQLAV